MNQLTAWEDDRAIGWSWAEGSKGVRHLGGITSDRKGTLSIAAVYVRCGDSPSESVHSRKKGFSLEVVEKQSRSNWELFSWLQTSEEFCRNFVGRRDQSIHVNKRFVYKIWFQKREARISVQSMRQSLKKIERKKIGELLIDLITSRAQWAARKRNQETEELDKGTGADFQFSSEIAEEAVGFCCVLFLFCVCRIPSALCGGTIRIVG